MKITRLSFSLLLPALELAAWLLLVPTQVGLLFWRLHHPASVPVSEEFQTDKMYSVLPNILLITPQKQGHASKHPFWDTALWLGTTRYSQLVTEINMPGVFVEALVSMPTSWPQSWHPEGMMLESWRAIILPFFCLPFWWFAGRGVDGVLGWRRLHWATMLLGSVLFAAFVVLLVGLRFGLPASDRTPDGNWIFYGFGLWILVLAAFPIAWLRRIRRRPKEKAKLAVTSELDSTQVDRAARSGAGEAAAASSAAPPTPANTISPGNEKG